MMNARQLLTGLAVLVLFIVLRGAGVSMPHVGAIFAVILGVCLVMMMIIAALHLSFMRH